MVGTAAVEQVEYDEAGERALRACPPFEPGDLVLVDLSSLMKARPVTVGDDRFLYLHVSRQVFDSQDELVLKSALLGSKDHYLRHGNVDIEHLTLIGYRMGIRAPRDYEVGIPVEVREAGDDIFCKASIYRGAEQADKLWHSITAVEPPMRWYPSAGGKVLERRIVHDPEVGRDRAMVTRTEWVNTALAQTPVNQAVEGVRRVPFPVFAKAVRYAEQYGVVCHCDEHGVCACERIAPPSMRKAITAGYGTDSAALTGGGALRRQSIEEDGPLDLFGPAVNRFLKSLGDPCACQHTRPPFTLDSVTEHFAKCEDFGEQTGGQHARRLLSRIAARRAARR